ncbi:unnamed protein product [Vicia faba]|uniref:RING-type domain-containing protein n=1 Tax=Vicia faba TaxID=3906 RepID=A0AAV1AH57_VICFA|nr:unnamed protein product [Vicia faba]
MDLSVFLCHFQTHFRRPPLHPSHFRRPISDCHDPFSTIFLRLLSRPASADCHDPFFADDSPLLPPAAPSHRAALIPPRTRQPSHRPPCYAAPLTPTLRLLHFTPTITSFQPHPSSFPSSVQQTSLLSLPTPSPPTPLPRRIPPPTPILLLPRRRFISPVFCKSFCKSFWAVTVTEKDVARDDESRFQNPILSALDSKLGGLLAEASFVEDFAGKVGQSTVLRIAAGIGSKRVALLGLGASASGPAAFKGLGKAVAAAAKSAQAVHVAVVLASSSQGLSSLNTASAIATGVHVYVCCCTVFYGLVFFSLDNIVVKCVPCSHIFCKACISRFEDCPLCGADIVKIEPDDNLQGVVDRFIEGHARIKRSVNLDKGEEAAENNKPVIYEDVSLERGSFLVQQAMRAFRAQNLESSKSRLSLCAEDVRSQIEKVGNTSELCSQLGAVLGMLGDCWYRNLSVKTTNVPIAQFKSLCAYWSKETIQAISENNTRNRAQLKWMHRMGPKNFALTREKVREKEKREPTQSEMFVETRKGNKGKELDVETGKVIDDINDKIQEDDLNDKIQEDDVDDEFQEDDIDLDDEFQEEDIDGEFQEDDVDEEFMEDDISNEFQEDDLDALLLEDKLE